MIEQIFNAVVDEILTLDYVNSTALLLCKPSQMFVPYNVIPYSFSLLQINLFTIYDNHFNRY